MKKFAAIVTIASFALLATTATAGGEIARPPMPPPPPPMGYYAPPQPIGYNQNVVVVEPGYFRKVGNDAGDFLNSGGNFIIQTVDLAVGVVTLGFVDVSRDDIR